jgi:serine/tyrosine/threonine adenylyltransferase
MTFHFPFENSFSRLPDRFFARVAPTPVQAPRLVRLNTQLAVDLGLDPDWLASPDGVEVLAGKLVPNGAEPIALAYAGHQFGHFVPQLGDGRAILLGEVIDRHGVRRDIQLKGSGRTPFSRNGDGRAALGPVLREYIVSEAMAALGIPTTRALAAVMTGEEVVRESFLPGAVLTRVAASHIRVGTFQYFAARDDVEAVRLLADHAIARHYPEAAHAERPYRAFLEGVTARRPPKDPTKGMRRNCTFRLPDNTRDKLLLAAVASNRTLSEEIEWRVEQWVALQEREAALKEREAALREHEAKLQAREERLAGLEAAADRVA